MKKFMDNNTVSRPAIVRIPFPRFLSRPIPFPAPQDQFYTDWDESFETFDQMGLHENLLRGIYAYGFEKPSAIQQKGIVPFARGYDVIQQAQSGTGKTATFCAGILQRLNYENANCQALVLAPTRELAQQIEKVMRALGDYLGVKCHACVGGTSVREDEKILRAGVHVVVGTPGRVYDMLRRRALNPEHICMFSLDEADEMLSRGFKDQIYDIYQLLPPKLQASRSRRSASVGLRLFLVADDPHPPVIGRSVLGHPAP